MSRQPAPTQEELRELLSAGRGLYELLNVSENADTKEITNSYRKLALKYHPDKNNGKTLPQMLDINKAHTILSNPRMRYLYDNYSVTEEGVHRNDDFNSPFGFHTYDYSRGGGGQSGILSQEDFVELINASIALGIQLVATPLRNIAIFTQTNVVGVLSGYQAFKRLYNTQGIRGLWRGSITQHALSFIGNKVSRFMTGFVMLPIKESYQHPLLKSVVSSFFEYPFELILTIYIVRQEFDSIFEIFNHLIEARGTNSLWVGFSLHMTLNILGSQLDLQLARLKEYSFEQYTRNPQSKTWRYINFILSSTFCNTLIYSSIMTPLTGLCYQRQLQSLLRVKERQTTLQLLKRNWTNGGLSRVYAGLIPLTCYLIMMDNNYV
ncbi:hypothetical protein PPL_11131 [Heterostelium album PN500]|uniref:J domain-containing protein n=1 Tax=Heterostelium pallidum (strain ATCC 26659 / Pp 5 / PN500) TaxID=670386 RepID=D3BT10_HETP5|nr:hypothetical protein PPL_11131 [Heterostelium album PN500]EFA75625.1 hypothetical protein PPL_11131 [Heterostelium album PN500]|eukprot:XP_020427759.1 hypothetical protein PPL_11131 [Heterostelium album PN500]